MRILITVASLGREFGGPTKKVAGLRRALTGLGHSVTVVGCGEADWAVGLGTIGGFHETPLPRHIAPIVEAVRRADVVHLVGYRDPVGLVAGLTAKVRRIPYVIEPAGMVLPRSRSFRIKSAFDRTLGRVVLRSAAGVVATSRMESAEIAASLSFSAKIEIRPNGFDVDELLPLPPRGAFREQLGIGSRVPMILALGRITPYKGIDLLVEALASVPGAVAVVAGPSGEGYGLRQLQASIERFGVGERVVLLPNGLWGRDKAQALADADCFCLPSRTENFGNAPVEAALCGLPVVVSDHCGASEWLGPAGVAVVPLEAPALAVALARELAPEARDAAVGRATLLREQLGWDRVARRQVEIYARAIGIPAA